MRFAFVLAGLVAATTTIPVVSARPTVPHASYWSVALEPGGRTTLGLAVSTTAPTSVRVEPAVGLTARNSGDSYAPSSTCRGISCWISGLPTSPIRLTPGHATIVRFAVSLPAHILPGQYLLGVSVVPPTVAEKITHGVSALVEHETTIGLAITVPGAPLRRDLVLPKVVDQHNVLYLVEHDTGNTFLHPTNGQVILSRDGRNYSARVSSLTVLPGGTAYLPLALPALQPGTYRGVGWLHYDHGTKVAYWRGALTVGATTRPTRPAPLKQVVVYHEKTPTWLDAIIIIAAFFTGTGIGWLIWLLVLAVRRRRRPPRHAARRR